MMLINEIVGTIGHVSDTKANGAAGNSVQSSDSEDDVPQLPAADVEDVAALPQAAQEEKEPRRIKGAFRVTFSLFGPERDILLCLMCLLAPQSDCSGVQGQREGKFTSRAAMTRTLPAPPVASLRPPVRLTRMQLMVQGLQRMRRV